MELQQLKTGFKRNKSIFIPIFIYFTISTTLLLCSVSFKWESIIIFFLGIITGNALVFLLYVLVDIVRDSRW